MSNSQGINVTLFDTHVRVPNGQGAYKNITLQDFKAELDRVSVGAQQEQAEAMRAFRLPNECLTIKVNRTSLHLLMYFPERTHELQYSGRGGGRVGRYTCPIPPTVVWVRLEHNSSNNRWVVEQTKWFCTDYKEDEIPSLEGWGTAAQAYGNHLWALPFPNQYGDGNMCVGANSYRTLYDTDLRGLNELYHHVLLASPFNDDLGTRTKDGWSPRQLFQFLDGKEEFPFEILPGHPGRITETVPESDDDEDEDDDQEEDDE